MSDHTEPTAYEMTPSEATSLWDLRRIWGDRYIVGYTTAGPWRAARIGNALECFTADTAEELRKLISEDYAVWEREARKAQS